MDTALTLALSLDREGKWTGRRNEKNHRLSGDYNGLDTIHTDRLCSAMVQHSVPNIRMFFRVLWMDWGTRMSEIFTVPFTIAAIISPSGYGQVIFGVMAILAFLVTAYRIWADERRQLIKLETYLAPRLRFEFDPNQPKFVSVTPTQEGLDMLYVRVIARALSPIVNNCRGYLQRVSQLDGERYVVLFDETCPLPWSYENPHIIQAKELNHDVDAFLDVAWFADPSKVAPALDS